MKQTRRFPPKRRDVDDDYFVQLLDMNNEVQKSALRKASLEGRDRATGELKWTGTVVDLCSFQLPARSLRRSLSCSDSQQCLCVTLCAWNKVMNLIARPCLSSAGKRAVSL